jgi:glycine cleavage system H protein
MTPTDRNIQRPCVAADGRQSRKIGITFHAQEELGDIVSAACLGRMQVQAGDAIADVESVKTFQRISCAAGEVVEVNEALELEPELLNSDPYGNYFAVLRIDSVDESALMSDAAEYDAFLSEA